MGTHTLETRPQTPALSCPRCGQNLARSTRSRGAVENLLTHLHMFPFQCQLCVHRFWSSSPGIEALPAERRECLRVTVWFPVSFVSEESTAQGFVLDLSVKGCAIESETRLHHDMPVSLEIQTQPPISVKTAVVRSALGKRFGLEFIQMESEERDRLRALVERQLLGNNPHTIALWHGQEV